MYTPATADEPLACAMPPSRVSCTHVPFTASVSSCISPSSMRTTKRAKLSFHISVADRANTITPYLPVSTSSTAVPSPCIRCRTGPKLPGSCHRRRDIVNAGPRPSLHTALAYSTHGTGPELDVDESDEPTGPVPLHTAITPPVPLHDPDAGCDADDAPWGRVVANPSASALLLVLIFIRHTSRRSTSCPPASCRV